MRMKALLVASLTIVSRTVGMVFCCKARCNGEWMSVDCSRWTEEMNGPRRACNNSCRPEVEEENIRLARAR